MGLTTIAESRSKKISSSLSRVEFWAQILIGREIRRESILRESECSFPETGFQQRNRERERQKLRNVQMSEAEKERGREGWRDPSKVVTE